MPQGIAEAGSSRMRSKRKLGAGEVKSPQVGRLHVAGSRRFARGCCGKFILADRRVALAVTDGASRCLRSVHRLSVVPPLWPFQAGDEGAGGTMPLVQLF